MKRATALAAAALLVCSTAGFTDIDNIDFGGNLMLEFFYSDNIDRNDGVSDQTDFFRSEGHIWLQADLDDNVTARISLEFDRAFNQAGVPFGNSANNLGISGSDDLDVYLEEAYVSVKNVFGTNFSKSIGRMFLNYGDNPNADNYNRWWGGSFVFGDARTNEPLIVSQIGGYEIDPFDGSVTQYEGENFTIDLVTATDVEEHIGLYGNAGRPDSDAYTMLLYGSYYGIEGHQIDVYFNWSDQKFDNIAAGALGFDGSHFIVGGRVAGDLNDSLAYKAEVAYQFQDQDRPGIPENEGLAAQVGLNYHPDTDRNPNIGVIYTYMAEDQNGIGFYTPYDAKTYGIAAEGIVKLANLQNSGAAVFTNMNVINVNGGIDLTESLSGSMDIYYFLATEDIVNAGTGNSDDDGGFEIDARFDYRYSDNLSTFLGGGVLFPGGALEDLAGNDDESLFFMTGVNVTF